MKKRVMLFTLLLLSLTMTGCTLGFLKDSSKNDIGEPRMGDFPPLYVGVKNK